MKNNSYHTDWEEFAELDSKWAILTDPSKKYKRWDEKDFFKTGRQEVKNLIDLIKNLNINVKFGTALDFGCGIGRLTHHLVKYFEKVYGVDISKKMISDAKALHNKDKKIIFIQNTRNNLKCFNNNQFDLVFSSITLQHIPDKNQIKDYLKEFLRVLKPGGVLFFQLPSIPSYSRFKKELLKIRGFFYYIFVNKFRLSRQFCYSRLKLKPFMHMNYMDSNEVKALFSQETAKILIFNDKSTGTNYLINKLIT